MRGPCDTNPKDFVEPLSQAEKSCISSGLAGPGTAASERSSLLFPAAPPSDDQVTVGSLLEAMGQGKREAAAEFVIRYGPQIRRRVRGKLRVSMRRLFDSQDILSTLGRRLDVYVHHGRFEPRSEGELWSLVFTIAERSVIEKARIWQTLTDNDSGIARESRSRLGETERPSDAHLNPESEFEQLLQNIPSEIDRQIARLWSMGRSSDLIASELGLALDQVRQRWCRTRDRLRAQFKEQSA